MALLRHGLLAAGCLFGCLSAVAAATPSLDFEFSGYVQGRATVRSGDAAPGPLNTQPEPDRAGGEACTQALLKRLNFSLGGRLPWDGWSVQTVTAVVGSQTQFQDLYLAWRPTAYLNFKAGRFRVPFGIDPQTLSAGMDTVERPLAYGFGNFGWVAPLGMEFTGERDYGLRADYAGPDGFAGFKPFVAAALVFGNGQGIASKTPTQIMTRAGVSSRIDLAELRHELTVGLSASCGWNRFIRPPERYLPIGVAGDLESNPGAAVTAEDLGTHGVVSVLGADWILRMNEVVLKGETLLRRVGSYASQGYYVTGLWELAAYGLPVDLVLRWEEAAQGYADGAHLPNRKYQAATAGFNWRLTPGWRLQADYIALLLDYRQSAFAGSDLFIAQLQFEF